MRLHRVALVLGFVGGSALVAAGTRLHVEISALGLVPSGPVYSVAELQERVGGDPQPWMGRTVRVRGTIMYQHVRLSPFIWTTHLVLTDTNAANRTSDVPLIQGPTDAMVAFLRRLPLIDQLLPEPPLRPWNTPAVYRLQLEAHPSRLCPTCYQAVLLDDAS